MARLIRYSELFVLAVVSFATAQEKRPAALDFPITVSGRAVDDSGKPIEGATVFLVATDTSPEKLLDQTTSDVDGRFKFRDAPLPFYPPTKTNNDYEQGTFQLFGKAPGRGFAWFGMRQVFIDPRFISPRGERMVMDAAKHGFYPDQPINVDLVFAPAKPITGRFIDPQGQPIAGVKLRMIDCDLAADFDRGYNSFRRFRCVSQAVKLMPDELTSISDADGRFKFAALPNGVVCHMSADHPDYGRTSFWTSNAEMPPAEREGDKVLPLPIDITLHKTRTVTVQVRFADTQESVTHAYLHAYLQLGTGTESGGYSDKTGYVTLKLPPGEYEFVGLPTKEMNYLRSQSKLIVQDTEEKQTAEINLDPGCVLVLKAVDATTGKGIRDVNFWYIDENRPGKKWFVQSNTTTNDFPVSNAQGEVRAVVAPGKRTYGIGLNPLPDGYVPLERTDRDIGREIELPAGKTVTLEFQLGKAPP